MSVSGPPFVVAQSQVGGPDLLAGDLPEGISAVAPDLEDDADPVWIADVYWAL